MNVETERNHILPALSAGEKFNSLLEAVMRRREHGFRSSFRDWTGEATSFPRELAEAALAHTVGDKFERAYRRGDALERRRELMEAWARYLSPDAQQKVISIAQRK